MRLVTGLKRYLHKKHGEGLLSAASVQVRPCAACAAARGAGARVDLQLFKGGRGNRCGRRCNPVQPDRLVFDRICIPRPLVSESLILSYLCKQPLGHNKSWSWFCVGL